MKLEVGQFVRTKGGIIDKILKLNKSYVKGVSQKDELYAYDIDNIVKASNNIIDILQVGDVITTNNLCGEITKIDIENNKIWIACCDYETCSAEDIKSVVTHEQMEQMAYKVGE